MHEELPEAPVVNRLSYGLPPIGRMSSFGMDLGSLHPSAPDTERQIPPTPSLPPPPPPVPQKDNTTVDQATESRTQPLQHQPSLGYRSMVQQAFDDSQKDASFSPTSTTNSVYRSNSTSTSDISPIISQKPHSLATSSAAQNSYPVIAEEPSQPDSRRNTTETLRAEASSKPQEITAPPGSVRPAFARGDTPSTQDTNLGKRPTSIESPTHPEPERASVVDEAITDPAKVETRSVDPPIANASAEKSLPPVPAPSVENVPSTERTASEEWKEWQAHRKQFNAQAGFQDSGPTTPHLPSPIGRTESPPKGTVREIAGRLESNSGRSTPSNVNVTAPSPTSAAAEQARPAPEQRPAPEPRHESFRPTIPGGWQSYTSTATSGSHKLNSSSQQLAEPSINLLSQSRQPLGIANAVSQLEQSGLRAQDQPTEPSIRPSHLATHRSETTESIPTAKAPVREANDGITKTAFAAAATAGTALASAFVGHPEPEPKAAPESPTRSEISSENEWDASSSDGGDEQPQPERNQASHHARSISPDPIRPSTPPTLAERPLVAASTPSSIATASESDMPRSEPIDYPAPLRTSRILDSSPMSRPPIPNVALSTIPTNEDNDRLQHEIVKSLTPKSSNIDGDDTGPVAPPMAASNNSAYGRTDISRTPDQISNTNQTNQIPSSSHTLATVGSQPVPSSFAPGPPLAQRPHLQQRFSWETGSDKTPSTTTPKQLSPAATNSPDTIREAIHPVSSLSSLPVHSGPFDRSIAQQTTTSEPPPVAAGLNQTTQRQFSGSQQPLSQSESTRNQPSNSTIQPAGASFQASPSSNTGIPPIPGLSNIGNNDFSATPPQRQQGVTDPVSFRSIIALGTPHERILAFNESRQTHAASDGQLEEWMQSLNISEHSDVFALNGRISNDATEMTPAHKPSPRRTMTDSVGSRHIQEDGKKLMAKAGRFGGKAGIAAKGLFAKGKEKIRTASSGEKVAY